MSHPQKDPRVGRPACPQCRLFRRLALLAAAALAVLWLLEHAVG
jgi:hypothetical protein